MVKYQIYLLKYGFSYKNREVVYVGKTVTSLEQRLKSHKEQMLLNVNPHSRILKFSLAKNRIITMERLPWPTELQAIVNFYNDKKYLITNLILTGNNQVGKVFIEQRLRWSSAKNFDSEYDLLDRLIECDEKYEKFYEQE